MQTRLLAVLESWPDTRVVTVEDRYIHAECATPLLRFVDDLELLIDGDSGLVQARSCSKIGLSDLGANRRRIERLRRDLEKT